ncbi:MAG: hypothetical protein ABI831_26410 [Betaproteobacteria bacterium]
MLVTTVTPTVECPIEGSNAAAAVSSAADQDNPDDPCAGRFLQ